MFCFHYQLSLHRQHRQWVFKINQSWCRVCDGQRCCPLRFLMPARAHIIQGSQVTSFCTTFAVMSNYIHRRIECLQLPVYVTLLVLLWPRPVVPCFTVYLEILLYSSFPCYLAPSAGLKSPVWLHPQSLPAARISSIVSRNHFVFPLSFWLQ